MESYNVLSHEYINSLFDGANFGKEVNDNIESKISFLKNSLQNQIEGYWCGATIYQIMVDGGFLKDAKTSETKQLTALGHAFISHQK